MKLQSVVVLVYCLPAAIAILGNAVERSPVSQQQRWTLSTGPTVQIGVTLGEPTYEFHRIAGAVRLRNGHIVIADGGSNEVRFYDATGDFLRAVGGEGGGPEEFQRIMRLFLLGGDTVAVFDSPRGRIVKFDQDGEFVRGIPIYPAAGVPRVSVHRFFADGSMLGLGQEATRQTVGLWTREYHLISYTPDGTDTKYLGAFPGAEVVTVLEEGLGYTRQPPLFARHAYFATGPSHFYHVWTGDNAINKYSQQGELVEVLTTGRAPQQVTDGDLRAARQALLERASTPLLRRTFTAVIEASPIPEFLPAFGWPIGEQKGPPILLDDVGNLWLLNFQIHPGALLDWTVLSEEGEHICDVSLPRELRPFQIGDDFVIGVVTDEDGVEYVQVYELLKP